MSNFLLRAADTLYWPTRVIVVFCGVYVGALLGHIVLTTFRAACLLNCGGY